MATHSAFAMGSGLRGRRGDVHSCFQQLHRRRIPEMTSLRRQLRFSCSRAIRSFADVTAGCSDASAFFQSNTKSL